MAPSDRTADEPDTPPVRLRFMTNEEFAEYRAHAAQNYANEKVRAGNWQADEAFRLAEETLDVLLPTGVETPEHHLFTIVRPDGASVGWLWLAERVEVNADRHAFIYEILIFSQFRRQGYGRAAMEAAEAQAHKLGLDKIKLHVFGHNQAARALYDELGYAETNVMMEKRIDP